MKSALVAVEMSLSRETPPALVAGVGSLPRVSADVAGDVRLLGGTEGTQTAEMNARVVPRPSTPAVLHVCLNRLQKKSWFKLQRKVNKPGKAACSLPQNVVGQTAKKRHF